eukprot:TRINITY_DN7032_c0_g1_i7.p1 TRINITY_DN7032_c0_g1~~TRINITY_DN7032_c0_g1_i7.p1  ORF type:complete len:285 (+),score=78.18 TRINITY_DN7032_c0_g1_i7:452-1306(+)
MNSLKRTNDVREEMLIRNLKQELSSVRPNPKISEASRRLASQKGHYPIYTHKRMLQMSVEKRRNLEKIAKFAQTPKAANKEKVNKEQNKGTLKRASRSNIKTASQRKKPKKLNETLFSDLSNISVNASSSNLVKTNQSFANDRSFMEETTEELELHRNCSFRPLISKRSRKLFAKNNTRRKSVVERVMDYEKYRKIVYKERVADSKPSFTPDLSRSKKSFKSAAKAGKSREAAEEAKSETRSDAKRVQAIEKLKEELAKRPNCKREAKGLAKLKKYGPAVNGIH